MERWGWDEGRGTSGGMERLNKKEKTERELMDTDISVVIAGGREEGELEDSIRGINSDKK